MRLPAPLTAFAIEDIVSDREELVRNGGVETEGGVTSGSYIFLIAFRDVFIHLPVKDNRAQCLLG